MQSTARLIAMLAMAAAIAVPHAAALTVTIKNHCSDDIQLVQGGPGSQSAPYRMAPGQTTTRQLANGAASQVFKHEAGGQATLAELTVSNQLFYDISIIPTGKNGPGWCTSLGDCKAKTGGVGFNRPMQIVPHGDCPTLTCLFDGCPDAYQFPADVKTHACKGTPDVDIIFCPGGSGGTPPQVVPQVKAQPAPPQPQSPPKVQAQPAVVAAKPAATEKAAEKKTADATPAAKANPAPASPKSDQAPHEESAVVHASTPESNAAATPKDQQGNAASVPQNAEVRPAAQDVKVPSPVVDQVPAPAQDAAPTKSDAVQSVGAPADSATQVSNKSSEQSKSNLPALASAGFGVAALVAGAAIFVVRRRKQQLDELDDKSPLPVTANKASCIALMITPGQNTATL